MSTTTAAPTSKVTASDAAEAGRTTGRPPTDPAGPTGRLATWLAATTLSDVPAGVQERAKYLLLDGVGCALVGAQLPVSRVGVEGVLAFDPAGSGVLVGWGERTTSPQSAGCAPSIACGSGC